MNKTILFLGLWCSGYWAWIAYMDWFQPEVTLNINLGLMSSLLSILTFFNTISSSVIVNRWTE